MDSFLLTNGGSAIDLASYVTQDPGPDFDFAAVAQPHISQNQLAEGGVLTAETNAPRLFKFPMLLASVGTYNGLEGLHHYIRQLARPGAVVDVKPEGATTAIRFDVIHGRLVETYALPLQRINRRRSQLELSVMPFGYLPTYVLLASTASVGLPGRLSIPGGSVIGDVPALYRVAIAATVGSYVGAMGGASWLVDTLTWGFGGLPSFAHISGGSFVAATDAAQVTGHPNGTATMMPSIVGNQNAVGSQELLVQMNATVFTASGNLVGVNLVGTAAWIQLAHYDFPAAIEPAYRGRFRVFLPMRWAASVSLGSVNPAALIMADVAPVAARAWQPLASSAGRPVATLLPEDFPMFVGTSPPSVNPWGASPGHFILDTGIMSLPPVASGLPQGYSLRVWANVPSSQMLQIAPQNAARGASCLSFYIGGAILAPADVSAGYLGRGLQLPTSAAGTGGVFVLDAISGNALIGVPTGDLASVAPLADARRNYRGDMPVAPGASVQFLDLYGVARGSVPTGGAMVTVGPLRAAASVHYRPRFAFARAI